MSGLIRKFLLVAAALSFLGGLAAGVPAAAAAGCRSGPGKSDSGHWYYRIKHPGHRRCWFLGEEGSARKNKEARRHEAERDSRKTTEARAEFVGAKPAGLPTRIPVVKVQSAAEAEGFEPWRLGLAPIVATDAPAASPAAAAPEFRHVDVESLLAAVPAASVAAQPPGAVTATEESPGPLRWLGMLTMALGVVLLLSPRVVGATGTHERCDVPPVPRSDGYLLRSLRHAYSGIKIDGTPADWETDPAPTGNRRFRVSEAASWDHHGQRRLRGGKP